jgi:hypothetical protein
LQMLAQRFNPHCARSEWNRRGYSAAAGKAGESDYAADGRFAALMRCCRRDFVRAALFR